MAKAFEAAGVSYVALEKDFPRYRSARDEGLHVLFADATRMSVLAAAGIDRSRLLVLTFDTTREAGRILACGKASAPQAHRLASAADEASAAELRAKDAEMAFPENLAAGVSLADQALLLCGLDQDPAARVVTGVRERLSPELTGSAGV